MRIRSERGSATIETVILLPAFGLFVAMIIFAGRLAITHQSVNAAAAEAARTATLARTPTDATNRATSTARHLLDTTTCSSVTVNVDTAGYGSPIGTPADVTVTITCLLPLGDLNLPIPGTREVTATARSPLDPYRGR